MCSVNQAYKLTAHERETTWKIINIVFSVVSYIQNLHHIEWLTKLECKSTTACRSDRHSKACVMLCMYMTSLVAVTHFCFFLLLTGNAAHCL